MGGGILESFDHFDSQKTRGPQVDLDMPSKKPSQRAFYSDQLLYDDIEAYRHHLGFTQKKMTELLKVDPSAWTRWRKSKAPAWAMQSLDWLVRLNDQQEALGAQKGIEMAVQGLSELESHLMDQRAAMRQLEQKAFSDYLFLKSKFDAVTVQVAYSKWVLPLLVGNLVAWLGLILLFGVLVFDR